MAEKNPLISNISPPTELPSFIKQQQPNEEESKSPTSSKFVPAIPAQQPAQQQQPQQKANEDEGLTDEADPMGDLPSMQDIAQALSPITDGVKNSVLFGWVSCDDDVSRDFSCNARKHFRSKTRLLPG